MEFGDDNFQNLLPSYLSASETSRLKNALQQFMPEYRGNEINYQDFYKNYQHFYFMQSDSVREIRFANWNSHTGTFEKLYTNALSISNTCDISLDNNREFNTKECLFAPLIELNEYLQDLEQSGYNKDKIQSFASNVRAQLVTNIFYLPEKYMEESNEYIARLDKVFWFPTAELNTYIDSIHEERIFSLNHYGYYLFILKLSYHLCRLPEKCDRELEFGNQQN